MVERVEDTTRVEVGRTYDVPCIVLTPRVALPVLTAEPHADPELGVSAEHHHYDTRFLLDWELEGLAARLVGYERPVDDAPAVMLVVERARVGKVIRRENRSCLRETPTFPSEVAAWSQGLAPTYSGRKWRGGCRACPHRGTPLRGLEPVGGRITCPAHGLKFDVETGVCL